MARSISWDGERQGVSLQVNMLGEVYLTATREGCTSVALHISPPETLQSVCALLDYADWHQDANPDPKGPWPMWRDEPEL